MPAFSPSQENARARTHTHPHTHTHTHTRARTRTLAHTHTHTHTKNCDHSPFNLQNPITCDHSPYNLQRPVTCDHSPFNLQSPVTCDHSPFKLQSRSTGKRKQSLMLNANWSSIIIPAYRQLIYLCMAYSVPIHRTSRLANVFWIARRVSASMTDNGWGGDWWWRSQATAGFPFNSFPRERQSVFCLMCVRARARARVCVCVCVWLIKSRVLFLLLACAEQDRYK